MEIIIRRENGWETERRMELPEDQCCELYEAGDFKTRFEYSDNRKRG